MSTLEINSLTPHIGAEVKGVDLSAPLTNEQFAAIHQAHLDWMVLVFRDQHLDREQHKAFARRFGKLHVHPLNRTRSGDPEILQVKTTADSAYTAGEGQEYPRNEHPVIVTHPETGRKLLYVNSGFTSHIKGLKARESRDILDMLFRHIDSTPRLTCRVAWQPNTLTFWDNRCTQHHSVWDYYPHSRYGERVSIIADSRPAA